MTKTLPPAYKLKKLQSKCDIFYNNLYYNYSCGGFHELNMSCVWEWDVTEVNDKRQPVIEVEATRAYWTNPRLGHVTVGLPMAALPFRHKAGAAGKIDFSSELYLIAFEIKNWN